MPHIPETIINNATLNGVDSDSNGIRDDIDRYIAETYPEPIEHAIAELNAKTFVDVFEDPKNAYEKKLYLSSEKAIDCKSYIDYFYGKEVLYNFKVQELYKEIINTAEREKTYLIYNSSLSGHVFSDGFTMTPNDCTIKIITLLKKYKKIK